MFNLTFPAVMNWFCTVLSKSGPRLAVRQSSRELWVMTEGFLFTTFSHSKDAPWHLQNPELKLAPPDSWRNQSGHPRWLGETQPCLKREGVQTRLKWSQTQAWVSAGNPLWEGATCVALEEAVSDVATLPPANKTQSQLISLSSEHQLRQETLLCLPALP